MKSFRSTLSLLALAAAAGTIWWMSRPQPVAPLVVVKPAVVLPSIPPASNQDASTEPVITAPVTSPEPPTTALPASESVVAGTPPPVLAGTLQEADTNPDLERLQMMFRDYRTALGENPVGTNAEITKALLGDNQKQLQLSVPDGSRTNGQGEMIDRWGTPYFFHQLSAKQMEIRSAGPDRQMWTPDDRLEN